jgi:hypothetical protein
MKNLAAAAAFAVFTRCRLLPQTSAMMGNSTGVADTRNNAGGAGLKGAR